MTTKHSLIFISSSKNPAANMNSSAIFAVLGKSFTLYNLCIL